MYIRRIDGIPCLVATIGGRVFALLLVLPLFPPLASGVEGLALL
jgi:hypothetical protein